jgi:UDP-N-acetylglucosamine--N-acetylmuramyl-(pentapeptide) pyrophosphoryl-undecaprenol N-acetylglucosamine transferase
LLASGAAVVLPEAQATPETLSDKIAQILSNPKAAQAMAAAALAAARPNAAQDLADLVETLAAKPVSKP